MNLYFVYAFASEDWEGIQKEIRIREGITPTTNGEEEDSNMKVGDVEEEMTPLHHDDKVHHRIQHHSSSPDYGSTKHNTNGTNGSVER